MSTGTPINQRKIISSFRLLVARISAAINDANSKIEDLSTYGDDNTTESLVEALGALRELLYAPRWTHLSEAEIAILSAGDLVTGSDNKVYEFQEGGNGTVDPVGGNRSWTLANATLENLTLKNISGGPTNHTLKSSNMGMLVEPLNSAATASLRSIQKVTESFYPYRSVAEVGAGALLSGGDVSSNDLLMKIAGYSVHTKGNDPLDIVAKLFPRIKRTGVHSKDNAQPGDLLPIEFAMARGVAYIMPRRNGVSGGNIVLCPDGAATILQGPRWQANEMIAIGDIRRVSYNMCLALECVNAGATSTSEPDDPPPYYSKIQDGSVVWIVVPTFQTQTGEVAKASIFIDQDGRVGVNTWAPEVGHDIDTPSRYRQSVEFYGDGIGDVARLEKALTKNYKADINIISGKTHFRHFKIAIHGAKVGDLVHVIPPISAIADNILYDANIISPDLCEMRAHNTSDQDIDLGHSHGFTLIVTRYQK